MSQRLYRNYHSWLLVAEPHVSMAGLSRRQVRRLAGFIAIGMLFAAALLWQRMQVVKMGYEVVRKAGERDSLLMENAALRRDLRSLYTLDHAEDVARRQLGMVNLDPSRVIYLPDPAETRPGLWQRASRAVRSWWTRP